MEQKDFSAEMIQHDVKKKFTYEGTAVLALNMSFPEVKLKDRAAQNRINMVYVHVANRFYNQAATELYNNAVEDYRYRMKNGFPFIPYEADLKYTVTLNGSCVLSLYFDQYTFTGGAHGGTIRTSDTWDLNTGERIKLRDLFHGEEQCCRAVTEQIFLQADVNMKKDPGIYFDNYRDLILQYFDTDSFYLTPRAVAVYYQQYEIAPYASGILVFEIPYDKLGVQKPGCINR